MRTVILPQPDRRPSISLGGGPGAPIFQHGPQTRIYRAPVRAVCAAKRPGTENEFWGQVLDISLGGCLLKTDADFAVGEEVEIRITIVGNARRAIADVRGRVRRATSDEGHPTFGIEFVAGSSEERRVLQWLYGQALR